MTGDGLVVALHPGAGEATASSRIRVFSLGRALNAIGVRATIGDDPTAGVVLFQKRADAATVEAMRAAKRRGATVFFDVDDLGAELWARAPRPILDQVLGVVDALTTDTALRRDELLRQFPGTAVEVIPDAIDYHPQGVAAAEPRDERRLRVLWFGNVSNLDGFGRYLRALKRVPRVDVQVMTTMTLRRRARLVWRHGWFGVVPWRLERFTADLRRFDLTCLVHDGDPLSRFKSNNKMITSICWGVPALVTRTPEYERTAAECGVPDAVFADEAGLATCVEAHRGAAARRAYLERAQPEVWRRYAPETIARIFLDVVARYRS